MELLMQRCFSGPLGTALVRLLNMSVAGGVLICVVALLRLALRKAPKWTRGILWAIVAVQLVCPVSIRSPLSVYALLPRSDEVRSDQVEVFRTGGGSEKPLLVLEAPQIAGYERTPSAPVPTPAPQPVGAAQAEAPSAPADPTPQPSVPGAPSVFLPAAGTVWLAGCALMLLYALLSWLRLRLRVRASLPTEDRCFRLCDGIDTPFILGVLRPRVYIPSGLNDAQRAAVAAHEQAHLRRGDHWWKLLGWLLLSVHWFNPLVWLAYGLMCRDIELGCDERAVRDMDAAQRADYSQALLDCAAPRALARVCPLAFGEVGIKERIKAVLHYKKPAFWAIVAAVAVCAVVAVCFLTRPGPLKPPGPNDPRPVPTAAPTPTPAPEPTAQPTPEPIEWPAVDPVRSRVYLLNDEFYGDDPFHAFSITLDMEAGTFQFYETPISSYFGFGRFERDGDILTIDDSGDGTRVNRFRLSDDGETLVWLAEGSHNFSFVHLTDGATFRYWEGKPRMTLDDVRTLAQKGEALTWEDLLIYDGEDVGSGLYIYHFPIDDEYCLSVSDGKQTGTPQKVMLLRADENGAFRSGPGFSIDIRTDDVNGFLSDPP